MRTPGMRTRACEGFTLIELLIASLVAVAIATAVLSLASQAQRIFRVQPEHADLQQRIRVAVDSLQQDLMMAGAGTYAGPARGPLNGALAPVMPYRGFGDALDPARATFFRADAISVIYVPSTPAQSTLAAPLPAGGLDVQPSSMPNCPIATATQVCGFEAGTRVLIVDDAGQWDTFNVDQINGNIATLRHRGAPSTLAFPAGAVLAGFRIATYFLKTDAATGTSLVRYDGWATELPVVDDVVGLKFEYFGDANPPRLTGNSLDGPGPWTTYGPKPPKIGETRGNWPPGENCVFAVANGEHVSRLAPFGAGTRQVELPSGLLTDGPWCPDAVAPNRFDADLLRIRRVRVTVRVQSALASLRGAGVRFAKPGTARAADLSVPDLEVQFDVAPRNLNLVH